MVTWPLAHRRLERVELPAQVAPQWDRHAGLLCTREAHRRPHALLGRGLVLGPAEAAQQAAHSARREPAARETASLAGRHV